MQSAIASSRSGTRRRGRGSRRAWFERLEDRLAPAGDFGLAFALGSPATEVVQAVTATDGPVVVGYFTGTVDFDPGPGTTSLTSAGGRDIFVASYDRMGRLLWARSIGGAGDDQANAVDSRGLGAADGGNIYLTGEFHGTVDFNPAAGVANLTSEGGADIFVARLDANGDFRWAARMGGVGDDRGLGIGLDTYHVVTTGTFSGTANFDPGTDLAHSQRKLTSNGGTDAYFSKLTTSGTWDNFRPPGSNLTASWAEQIGGPGDDGGTAVAVKSSSGYSFFTGYFSGTANLQPFGGFSEFHTSAGGTDAYLLQLDYWGYRDLLKTMGGVGDDRGTSLALDPNTTSQDAYIYAGGSFRGTVDFSGGLGTGRLTSAGGADAYLARYRWLNGDLAWARSAGGAGDDATNALAADYGGVSAAGQYTGPANFAAGPATFNLYDAGRGSGSLWRLSPSGGLLYARGMGGAQATQALGVGIGLSGSTFVGGRFQGTADFDQGFGGSNTLSSAGGDDGFVAKFQDYLDMAPIARDDAFTAQEGSTLHVLDPNYPTTSGIMANDTGGSPTIVSYPQHGLLSPYWWGDFDYIPAPGFTGTDSFTYRALDSSLLSNLATVTLTVTASGTDLVPTLQSIPDQVIYPSLPPWIFVRMVGTDADGDTLSYSTRAQTLPFWLKSTYGLYQDAGGYFTNRRGLNEKYIRGTSSASGYSDPNGYWYYILPNGDLYEQAPPYSSPTLIGTKVASLGTPFYNDPTLLLRATNDPVPASVSISQTNLIWVQPNAGYAGTFVVIGTVRDGRNSVSRSFKVQVVPNTPPSLAAVADRSLPTNPPPLTLTLIGSDPDAGSRSPSGQMLSYSASVVETVPVTVGVVLNQLTLTVGAGYTGTFTVNASVSDGTATATRSFRVSVGSTAHPPVAGNDSATTAAGTAVRVNVLANDSDPDGDPLTIQSVGSPAHGTATIDNNGTPGNPADDKVVYTPAASYVGADVFTYTIGDGHGGTATANVSVTVAAGSPAFIVDDGGAGWSAVGTWPSSSLGGFQGDSVYNSAGTGADTASWTFAVTPGRTYRVMATWKPSSNRATDAPFTALDGATALGTVAVNQRLAPSDVTAEGASWKVLGSYAITGGQLVVRLSDAADGIVVADAVRIEEVAAPPPPSAQVVDDGGAGWSAVGTWPSSSLGGFQGDSVYNSAGTGADTASWTFAVTPGRTYRVMATWKPYSNRATDAPFTALDGATALGTVAVNQRLAPSDVTADGASWKVLGSYAITGSQLVVRLSDAANGVVVADAVRIEEVAAPPPPSAQVVDDGGAGWSAVGTWPSSSLGGFQGDSVYNSAGTGADTASWTFAVTPGRTYRVMATWLAYSNRATDAPFTVLSGTTALGTVAVNQRLAPSDVTAEGASWKVLGSYAITGGQLVVRLSDAANGVVVADAVRIEEVGSGQGFQLLAVPAPGETDSTFLGALPGNFLVRAGWASSSGRASAQRPVVAAAVDAILESARRSSVIGQGLSLPSALRSRFPGLDTPSLVQPPPSPEFALALAELAPIASRKEGTKPRR